MLKVDKTDSGFHLALEGGLEADVTITPTPDGPRVEFVFEGLPDGSQTPDRDRARLSMVIAHESALFFAQALMDATLPVAR